MKKLSDVQAAMSEELMTIVVRNALIYTPITRKPTSLWSSIGRPNDNAAGNCIASAAQVRKHIYKWLAFFIVARASGFCWVNGPSHMFYPSIVYLPIDFVLTSPNLWRLYKHNAKESFGWRPISSSTPHLTTCSAFSTLSPRIIFLCSLSRISPAQKRMLTRFIDMILISTQNSYNISCIPVEFATMSAPYLIARIRPQLEIRSQ